MAAKKTNKTEHVMSLLTGQPAGHSADAGAGAGPLANASKQTIESQTVASQTIISQTIKEQAASSPDQPQTAAHHDNPRHTPPPGVKFVESPSEDNPISSAIKESLEREALQMGIYTDETFGLSPGPLPERTEEAEAPLPENTPLPAAKETAEATPEEVPYRYVNIMEEGVKDRCLEFMTKLDICTCDRCQKDVAALALTNLPAKYIVADTAAIAPLMNYYKNKYSAYIMTELAKACFFVHGHPRH